MLGTLWGVTPVTLVDRKKRPKVSSTFDLHRECLIHQNVGLTNVAAQVDAKVTSNTSRLARQRLRFAKHLTALEDDILAFPSVEPT
jgi:hypothetical protein